MSFGALIFRGDSGKTPAAYYIAHIDGILNDAALGTFATAMATHTDANVAFRVFTQEFFDDDSAPGTDENVDRYARIVLKDTSNGKRRSIKLACPLAADVEQVPEGERLTASALGTIASACSVATGLTLTGVKAVVLQKE